MSNSIIATIPFDFRGKRYTPSTTIDLDEFIAAKKDYSNIFSAVAMQNSIGLYSYEYEILMASAIHFSQPEGVAEQYLSGDDFDLEKFRQAYYENRSLEALQSIARKHMQIEELEQNLPLKRALLEACKYGESLTRS